MQLEVKILFDVLKNACRVGARQLGTNEPGRTPVLRPGQIEAAYLLRDKTPPANPRLTDVLLQIACLGVFWPTRATANQASKRSGWAWRMFTLR
jgi:hypothetical protein